MPVNITDKDLNEEASGGIQVSFTDTDGTPVTPNAGLTWTLTDTSGTVINAREDVAISEDTTVIVVLTADDLAIQGTDGDEKRVITVEGTYNSSTLGNNAPIKEQATFMVRDLVAVS